MVNKYIVFYAIFFIASEADAFLNTIKSVRNLSRSEISKTYNVPPPSVDSDPNEIKEASDREAPPSSFFQLQINCARSAELAIRNGHKLIEVEFPPLPAQVLEMDDVSAYQVAAANIDLAIDFAKSFAAKKSDPENSDVKLPKRTAILLPDEAEAGIAIENLGGPNPYPGITISSLIRSDKNDKRIIKPEQLVLNLFGRKNLGAVKPIKDVDMYIIVVASAQELPDVEELHQLEPDKIICFYNLKLDILRGDLGAPAFPPKDFQDRFLSRIKPVYYLRTRQYSRSVANPPFVVNFQGCLFRSYPGQFQTLLDTGNGKYRRVVGSDTRPGLGEFKQQLTNALTGDGVIKDEGNFLNFLRTGYKTSTWWEEEREDADDGWRT